MQRCKFLSPMRNANSLSRRSCRLRGGDDRVSVASGILPHWVRTDPPRSMTMAKFGFGLVEEVFQHVEQGVATALSGSASIAWSSSFELAARWRGTDAESECDHPGSDRAILGTACSFSLANFWSSNRDTALSVPNTPWPFVRRPGSLGRARGGC